MSIDCLIGTTCSRVFEDYPENSTFDLGPVTLAVDCLWRIETAGRVALTSRDHRQQFALPSPVDANAKAHSLLQGKRVLAVRVVERSADLYLDFEGGLQLQIIADSSGNESWNLRAPRVHLVALGGGRIADFSFDATTQGQEKEFWEFDYDHCFVCEGPRSSEGEIPGQWMLRRVACPEHAREALLPTGESVGHFVDRRADKAYPFEGYLLNFVVNPGDIRGDRVWLNFYMGGVLAVEQIFPSDNFFEYVAQHRGVYLDELYAIFNASTRRSRLPTVLRRTLRPSLMLRSLITDLLRQRSVDAMRQEYGIDFPSDPESALEILEHSRLRLFRDNPWLRWVFAGVETDLLEVGRRRFSHLLE